MRYKIKNLEIMAQNKRNEFEETQIKLADLAKTLSHPARWAILATLAQHQSCICGQIVEVLPLAQATVSQHLKELKNAGFIDGHIDGVKSCYCINWQQLNQAIELLNTSLQQLQTLQPTKGCC